MDRLLKRRRPALVAEAGRDAVQSIGNYLSNPAEPVKPMGAGLLSRTGGAAGSAGKLGAKHEPSALSDIAAYGGLVTSRGLSLGGPS